MQLQAIQHKIYEIRGQKVMLDFDLAMLYEVETRALNQAIKGNIESFPEDFMFRLSEKEWQTMSSQFVMTSSNKRPKKALPYAFTEHGVTMLASVLKSTKARKMAIQYSDIIEQIKELHDRVSSHDTQLNQIYEALENMLEKKMEEENQILAWKSRERIVFNK